jgi:hypothetical protein
MGLQVNCIWEEFIVRRRFGQSGSDKSAQELVIDRSLKKKSPGRVGSQTRPELFGIALNISALIPQKKTRLNESEG